MDKDFENSYRKPLLKEINNKQEHKSHRLDYEMFSNVIQNAHRTVELNKMRSEGIPKVTDEKPPVNPNEDTDNNMGTCREKSIDNIALKSKQTKLLFDVKFAIGFLEYGNQSIMDSFRLCSNIFDEINVFKDTFECIEGIVSSIEDDVQNSEFQSELNWKVKDGETVINIDYILGTGRNLLLKQEETLKIFNFFMKHYYTNLKTILKAVSKICSISLETEFDNNRDLMYDMIKQADIKIAMVHKDQNKKIRNYNKQQSNFMEMHSRCSTFLDRIADNAPKQFKIKYCN